MTAAAWTDPDPEPRPLPPLPEWLIDAADLLAEPDPGPTPWLVEGLIVDQALTAVVGKWKTTKSWGMLEIAVSIATGAPAFGAHQVTEPGPVVYVIEESGRTALWRRLDALCRGRAIRPDQLRGRLALAPNTRLRLDDASWQQGLREVGHSLQPRAFIFDPLARMKAPARDESAQTDMAVVIEYLRHLRDDTGAAVLFVHHTGHQGEHMRGSSDLESAWESRLAFKREGEDGDISIRAEHREDESGAIVAYRLAYDGDTRTMRLRSTVPPLAERITEWLREHGPGGAREIAKGIGIRRTDVARTLATLAEAGTARRGPSGKTDALGRPNPNKVWHLNNQAESQAVPNPGQPGTSHPSAAAPGPGRPPS